ncbi:phage major capsid protein [Herminiimonas sp. CN]|uniref:phage major capsid protein n=1 Tax=Herminiimonas sp. CN TaxID=1349818 RepID=UPI000473604B|nr:phage major capsid protein [Herminiimonas sp. CN]
MSIQAQRERRNALVTQAKQLNAEKVGALWTPEVSAAYDALVTEIGQIDDSMTRQQKILDLEADKKFEDFLGKSGGREIDAPTASIGARFIRSGFESFSKDDYAKVRNTLSVGGAGSEGGYTVQTEIVKQVADALKAFGGMRSVAETIQTAQGNPMSYPTSDGTGEIGEIIGENTPATALDPAFGTLPLNVYKFSSKIIAIPFELLQDSAIDVEAFINARIVTRLGRIGNLKFTVGSGSGEPTGVVTAVGVGKTGITGQTVTVIYDDLIDLQHSVDPAYRENGKFMMHDSTVKYIRKLKDVNGRPLWVPDYDGGIAGGKGGTLAGSEVVLNQQMPVMAANAKSILFGDFSYYKIRDVMAMNLFRFTDSVYASKGQVGFLAWMRSGGNWIDVGGAVKAYQNSAT